MSAFTFKPVACRIPPVTGASSSNPKVSKVKMMNKQAPPSLQVKGKENGQESLTMTSRREIMQVAAASIGLLSLLLPAPAEARPKNTTMKQKIMEKFEKLREKAGLSEPKDEGDEKSKLKDEEDKETKLKLKNGSEEKKAQNNNGNISSGPTLPNIINGTKTTVEPILP